MVNTELLKQEIEERRLADERRADERRRADEERAEERRLADERRAEERLRADERQAEERRKEDREWHTKQENIKFCRSVVVGIGITLVAALLSIIAEPWKTRREQPPQNVVPAEALKK